MEKILLIRYGEISLKGLNRHYFVDTLLKNIKYALRDFDMIRFTKIQSRITVENIKEDEEKKVIDALKKVFGIVYITRSLEVPSEFELIKEAALLAIKDIPGNTFKVEAKRGDKQFPLTSPEISKEVGAHILRNIASLKVDVHDPDIKITIEVRDKTYINYENIKGESGLPLGTGGYGAVMLSGGIDSPVASYMMARRGMKITGIHFHSYPFTSLNAKEKVVQLGKKLSAYNNGIDIVMISLTQIQQEIIKQCNETYLTVILRRFMIRCAQIYAKNNGIQALITGESLGQVASQTVESITCTSAIAEMPVFRPLIGMDKNQIVDIAKHIDTFETSIQPYEDCCTIFVPKHPQTRPSIEKVLFEEAKITSAEEMVEKAVAEAEIFKL